jgi:hypothetical protein
MKIMDQNNVMQIVQKTAVVKKDPALPYLSLISLSERSVATIQGCAYDISQAELR